MERVDKLWLEIKNYMTNESLTLRGFAKKCGFNPGYVAMIKKGEHPTTKKPFDPSVSTLEKLAAAMDMSLEELMRKCGYFD